MAWRHMRGGTYIVRGIHGMGIIRRKKRRHTEKENTRGVRAEKRHIEYGVRTHGEEHAW